MNKVDCLCLCRWLKCTDLYKVLQNSLSSMVIGFAVIIGFLVIALLNGTIRPTSALTACCRSSPQAPPRDCRAPVFDRQSNSQIR